jgi:dihydroorotate dehydrogenase (NAD+) catalytic subunit
MPIDLAPNNPYGLTLRNPVLAAAGCFGYGVEYARTVDLTQLGAIVTRSTSLRPRRGSRPRVVETPAGVLLVSSWPNPGLEYVVRHHAPVWAAWETPVILSVIEDSPTDYARFAKELEWVEGIAGLELNLADAQAQAAAIVGATRAATQLPLLAKLPALDAAALIELAHAVVAAGADALTLVAPPHGLQIDVETGERIEGRLCGPAIHPPALRLAAAVAAVVSVPVVGCGGIASSVHARQFLAAGASAVQIGVALLSDPFLAGRIGGEL